MARQPAPPHPPPLPIPPPGSLGPEAQVVSLPPKMACSAKSRLVFWGFVFRLGLEKRGSSDHGLDPSTCLVISTRD